MVFKIFSKFKANLNFLSKLVNYSFILNSLISILLLDILFSTNFLLIMYTPLNYVLDFITYWSIVFYLGFFLITISLIFRNNNNLTFLNNSLLLQINYYLSNIKVSFFENLEYLFAQFFFTLNNNAFKFYFLNSILLNLRPIYWYPIFKRHSIFGYYRIARQNWVELKSEEVNFIKY